MKEIAFKNSTVAKEQLPLPIVLYPGFYGTFFGFKKNKNNSQIFFCSCSKEPIENYLNLRLLKEVPKNSDPNRMFILDSKHFHLEVVESLCKKKNIPNNHKIIQHLNFENKLCHECNKIIPSYRYCHEMYGVTFKQNYGWYINKQSYEWGIGPLSFRYLPDACPEELVILLGDENIKKAIKKEQEFSLANQYLEAIEQRKIISKHHRKIKNVIENEVRRKFGHKKVGEAWTSETILYYIVQTLFPDKTILRHYHPDFLEGLEIDIFIKDLNIGIEYQGIQHYRPIKHWGGKESLYKLRKRDQRKKKICDKLGVKLIYFDYNEELSNDFVLTRIKKYK